VQFSVISSTEARAETVILTRFCHSVAAMTSMISGGFSLTLIISAIGLLRRGYATFYEAVITGIFYKIFTPMIKKANLITGQALNRSLFLGPCSSYNLAAF
jgi:hypothetical protein